MLLCVYSTMLLCLYCFAVIQKSIGGKGSCKAVNLLGGKGFLVEIVS